MKRFRFLFVAAAVIAVAGLGTAGSAAPTAVVTVSLTPKGPQPAKVSVSLGDTVTFVNNTPDARVLKSDDPAFPQATIAAGASYAWVALDPGNISYRFGDGRTDRGSVSVKRDGSVGLTSKPKAVTYGQLVTLSGVAVPAGFPVAIESRKSGAADWTKLTTVTPATEGTFSFQVKPTIGTQYRASLFDGILRSPRVTIQVKPSIRLTSLAVKTKTDRTIKLRALVTPRDAGSRISLSIFSKQRNGWKRVSSQALRDGRAVIPWKAMQGTTPLRLSIEGRDVKQGFEGAVSNVIRVTGIGAPAEPPRRPRDPNRADRNGRDGDNRQDRNNRQDRDRGTDPVNN